MIQEFISLVKHRGLARTNRYLVTLGHPTGFIHKATNLASLLCDGAAIPGMNLESFPVRIYGESRDMPYAASYNPVILNFYMDAEMRLKGFFDKWMDAIVDPVTRGVNYFNTYTTTINIRVLDVEDAPQYEIQLIDAWPKTVSDITLDYNNRDVMKLPVIFQYKNWKRVA